MRHVCPDTLTFLSDLEPMQKHALSRDDLGQKVYDWLYQQIVSEAIPTGERLVETEIAEALGVSRTPVREAIVALEKEGILRSVPRKGVYVNQPTADEVRELFDVRIALEGYAARLATPRLTQDDLDAIREREMAGRNALDDDLTASTEADIHMHRLLTERAGNARIKEMLHGLNAQIHVFRKRAGDDSVLVKEFLAQRWRLYEALVMRDADQSERLMREHIASVRDWALRAFPV